MRFLKWAGRVALTALSAGVLTAAGVGAAVASAAPHHHGGDLVDITDVVVPVTVFAPITVTDVLNDLDILSGNDIDIHDIDVDVLSD